MLLSLSFLLLPFAPKLLLNFLMIIMHLLMFLANHGEHRPAITPTW
jgi:hypothetical protein